MLNPKILDAISGTGAAAPAGAAPAAGARRGGMMGNFVAGVGAPQPAAPAAPQGTGFGMPGNSIRALLEKNYDAIMPKHAEAGPTGSGMGANLSQGLVESPPRNIAPAPYSLPQAVRPLGRYDWRRMFAGNSVWGGDDDGGIMGGGVGGYLK